MASSAVQGFVQGFAGTLAPIILERKKEARDYFNKQVEYARTKGLENRNRVKQESDATLAVARQLEQIGVPKNVIMAQINMDPNGLGNFYQNIDKLNAERASENLPPLTAAEISGMVNVGGNFKAPDEDLATFVSRTYEPISRAVRDPAFSSNPENSLWASMMGYSAMDEARAELGNTVVADGMTAEDLINYGDSQPQKIGGQAVVTTNYDGLPREPEKPVSPSEANIIRTAVADIFEKRVDLGTILGGEDPAGDLAEIVDGLATAFPSIERSYIEGQVMGYAADKGYVPAEETPVTGETLAPAEVEALKTAFGLVDIVDLGNGQAEITYSDGKTETGPIDQLKAELQKLR